MVGKLLTVMMTASVLAGSPSDVNVQMEKKIAQEVSEKAVNPFEKNGVYENMSIIYTGENKLEALYAEDVVDWVRYWEDGHWDIDDDRIAEYIAHLQDVFNTNNHDRTFETTMGDTVTITRGEFGWAINKGEETTEISKLLRNDGASVHRIHFSREGKMSNDPEKDYGDSYIEIDLTRQVLWLYEEGRVTLISNIVSGMMNTSRQTPGGIYSIYYKQSPAVLNGEDYSQPVDYWMPFNGGIGLHDATWQSSFGGDACYYRGSHGCINLPLSIAKAVFNKVERGFPVICYYSNPEDEI